MKLNGTLDNSSDKDTGYTVEIRIPFASLSKAKQAPPKLGDTWRVNLYAMENNGGVAWSPILGQGNFHKASRFGRLLWADKNWQPPTKAAGTASASASALAAPGASAPVTAAPALRPAPPKTGAKSQGPLVATPKAAVAPKGPVAPKAPTAPNAPVAPKPVTPPAAPKASQ